MSHRSKELALRRLQTEATLSFARLHRELVRHTATIMHEFGLEDITPAQAAVLMVLFQSPEPLTARQVAHEMALSEVTVGRFVRTLEQTGWVERQADDADNRALLILLTRRARKAFPRYTRVSNRVMDEAFDGISESALKSMSKTLAAIGENLDPDHP